MTGLDLIKKYESLRLKAYPDPATGGKPITIGYGSTKTADGGVFKLGDVITPDKAEALLIRDYNEIKEQVLKDPAMAKLPEGCVGAIVSLCYNIKGGFGAFKKSKCYQGIVNRNIADIFHNFDWGVSQKGVELGLARRRADELLLFLTSFK